MAQERLLLEKMTWGIVSVPRLEQTCLSKDSGDDDTAAPCLRGNHWEGAAPKPPPHMPLIITPSPLGVPALLSPIHNSA